MRSAGLHASGSPSGVDTQSTERASRPHSVSSGMKSSPPAGGRGRKSGFAFTPEFYAVRLNIAVGGRRQMSSHPNKIVPVSGIRHRQRWTGELGLDDD